MPSEKIGPDFEQALPDVCVVGTGIRIPEHFTIETLEVLHHCREIYTILQPDEQALLFEELRPKVRSLWTLYKPGALRKEVYELEVEAILGAAAQQGPVAFLTKGNPVILDSVTHGILARAGTRGLTVRIFPGISSIDAILVDLGQELAPGLQIYEASSLVASGIEPQVNLPCLLMQPNLFGTAYVAFGYQALPEAFAPLRNYLLRFYPPEHEVTYITSTVLGRGRAQVSQILLQELGGSKENPQEPGASLFIPPVQILKRDAAFLARMGDPASLSEPYRRRLASTE